MRLLGWDPNKKDAHVRDEVFCSKSLGVLIYSHGRTLVNASKLTTRPATDTGNRCAGNQLYGDCIVR